MGILQRVLNGLGSLFDTVAGIAPGELQNEIGFLVTLGVTLGVLHVTDASAFAQSLFALVSALLAVGIAIERAIKAAKGTPLPNPAPAISTNKPVVK